jgi:predicted transcriptional regulator
MQKQDSEETPDANTAAIDLAIDNAGTAMALTVDLVRAYVANHTVPAAQLGALLEQTHRTVLGLASFRAEDAGVSSIEGSVRSDFIMCLECGKLFRSLKRHLAVHHGMTPAQYRTRWSLPPDYPMVAPDYAASRSKLAISMGFGGKKTRKGKRRRSPRK